MAKGVRRKSGRRAQPRPVRGHGGQDPDPILRLRLVFRPDAARRRGAPSLVERPAPDCKPPGGEESLDAAMSPAAARAASPLRLQTFRDRMLLLQQAPSAAQALHVQVEGWVAVMP